MATLGDETGGDAEVNAGPAAGGRVVSYELARLRQALPKLVGQCMSFSAMTRFDDALVAAVYRFYGLEVDVATAESEILEDEGERVRFFPWFLWDWRGEDGSETVGEAFAREVTLAPFEARVTDALNRSSIGFYEVVSLDLADGVAGLSCLLTQASVEVSDPDLAADIAVGQILQARLVMVEGERSRAGAPTPTVALVDAVYAVLPGKARGPIQQELKSLLGDTPRPDRMLSVYAAELLDFTDHLLDTMARPPEPLNGDGEMMVLVRSRLGSGAREAALAALSAEAPEDFKHVDDGLWSWVVAGTPTGFLDARRPGALVLGANSIARADALAARFEAATGVSPRALRSVEDFGVAVHRWVDQGGSSAWLACDPDIRSAVRAWFATWARQWLDMPLESLSDRSPREAARDAAGRARVEAMIGRFERMLAGTLSAATESSLALLRSEIGA